MNILILGNNYTSKVLSECLSLNKNNKIFSTISGENVHFVDINYLNFKEIINFSKNNNIELIVPADFRVIENENINLLTSEGLSVFSPLEDAIQITAYKFFAKKFFYKNNILTPPFILCEKPQFAYDYIKQAKYPIVIKPNCHNEIYSTEIAETYTKAKDILDKFYKNDIDLILFEEFIEGKEFTVYAISDGFNVNILDCVTTKYNRYAYLGTNFLNKKIKDKIYNEYFKKIIIGLENLDMEYTGILGIDFIQDKSGEIYVLECNPFFENLDAGLFTNSIKNDLADIFESVIFGTFSEKYKKIEIEKNNFVSFINDKGKIELYEGRTLAEAIKNSENKEFEEIMLWKY